LLVVGAAWVAVLLPPLLRSRLENRPGSSIDSFQTRLSSLQRSVPSTGMRGMARPLAGGQRTEMRHGGIRPVDVRYAPQRAGAGQQRSSQQRLAGYAQPAHRATPANTPQRFDLRGARQLDSTRQIDRRTVQAGVEGGSFTGLQRRDEARQRSSHQSSRRETVAARPRATVKQRRQNVLFLLILVTATSGLFVAAANNTASKAVLAVSACALVGYMYLLAQMRRTDHGVDEYYGYEAA